MALSLVLCASTDPSVGASPCGQSWCDQCQAGGGQVGGLVGSLNHPLDLLWTSA